LLAACHCHMHTVLNHGFGYAEPYSFAAARDEGGLSV